MLLLAPWSGSLADRFDRRRLLLATQPVSALLACALALVTALDAATAPLVIGLVLAAGVVAAFSVPAQMALVASLVPPRDLPSAVALNSMTFNIARVAGPALAGLTIATIGIAESFAVNAATYLLFALALLTLTPREQERAARGESRLRDSVRLVMREPRLLAYLLIVAAVGFASDPVNTLAPAFAEEFGYADTVSGLIIGVFGVGAVTAAFFVAGRTAGSRRRIIATLALMGFGIIGFALSPRLELGFVFLFLAGIGYLSSNTAATTRLQLDVRRASADGSWRSGRLRSSACGRSRASSTERSRRPPESGWPGSCSRSRCWRAPRAPPLRGGEPRGAHRLRVTARRALTRP